MRDVLIKWLVHTTFNLDGLSQHRVPGEEDMVPAKCARAYIAAGMAVAVEQSDRRMP